MKPSLFVRYTVYSIIVLLAGDNVLFGAQGTKIITNYLGSGLSYITNEYSSLGEGAQQVGISASSFYSAKNGNWLPYPADNRNYLRGDSFLGGTLYDEQNSSYYVNPAGTSSFNRITGTTPTADTDLATKEYVDAASGAGGGASSICYALGVENSSVPPSCGVGYTAAQTWSKPGAYSCSINTKLGNRGVAPIIIDGVSYSLTCGGVYYELTLSAILSDGSIINLGGGSATVGYEKTAAVTLCCN